MTVRISSFTSLTPSKPILYVLLIENVLGKLSTDAVGAGTIPHCLQKCILRRQLRTANWRMEKAAWQLVVNGMVLRHVLKSGNMFKPSFGNKMTCLSLLFLIISLLFHYYFTIISLLFFIIIPPFFARVRIPAIPKWSWLWGQSTHPSHPLLQPPTLAMSLANPWRRPRGVALDFVRVVHVHKMIFCCPFFFPGKEDNFKKLNEMDSSVEHSK